tara:strand:+ start:90 stop:260 length:171 start_codon:yes stop_codon:yes gene_type:complete
MKKNNNNYIDAKTERRNKYNKKHKGKLTKTQKNYKSLRREQLRMLDDDKDMRDAEP